MKAALTCCSALYARELSRISGDIPGRDIYFGCVDEPLPEIAEPEYNFRSCRLLAWAIRDMGGRIDAALSRYGRKRMAIVLGASNTGVDEAQRHIDASLGRAPDSADGKFAPEFRFSMLELGTPSEYLAAAIGVEGPCYTISTACSSSAKAFPAARRLIEAGICDAAIVGGVDGRCRFAMNGFHALGALAQERCRPLAEDRDGICLGEGVALFMMERVDAADWCGECPVFFSGAGESSDAYHATAPDPEGRGAETAMRAALADAGCTAADVDYVNLHGTGTQANDDMEMKAVRRVFGEARPVVESTKSFTGHCLGAAGAVEAAICWKRIRAGESRRAISNSFAFGGSNASIVMETMV
jgi:3-oxoacyl-[acyl-carrier-protein] synthase-1